MWVKYCFFMIVTFRRKYRRQRNLSKTSNGTIFICNNYKRIRWMYSTLYCMYNVHCTYLQFRFGTMYFYWDTLFFFFTWIVLIHFRMIYDDICYTMKYNIIYENINYWFVFQKKITQTYFGTLPCIPLESLDVLLMVFKHQKHWG